MIFNRKVAVILAVVLSLAVLSGVIAKGFDYIAASGGIEERQVIILDAGHGGFDGGAVAPDGTVEKDINL